MVGSFCVLRVEGFRSLPTSEAEEFFLSLDTRSQAELLTALPPEERQLWMRQLPPDDAADAVQSVEPERRDALLAALDSPTRHEVAALLAYAEDEAGGLMSPRYVRLRPEMTVDEAIAYLRRAARERVETIYYIYVLDAEQRLVGVVSCPRPVRRAPRRPRARRDAHPGHLRARRPRPGAFLGVVLSHLASALYGDRIPGVAVPQGGFAPVGNTGWVLRLDRFDAVMAAEGYPKEFSARVTLYRDRTPVARGVVRTNEPLFHEGYGIYIKNFGSTPWGAPYAVFDANRDPGAAAILVSSLLFTAANLLYLYPSRRTDA